MPHRDWARDELILAMNLYCQLPFGRLHKGTPEIVALAGAIGRTPSSVSMKLCNLASLDPAQQERGVKGLSGASTADRRIWDEFHSDWEALAIESERLRAEFKFSTDQRTVTDEPENLFLGKTELNCAVNVRLAQRFFRRAVFASFENRCCITGIQQSDLLIASHIVPWHQSTEHRANPRNGLCLSRLHDGAFDRGLIAVDTDYRLIISSELAQHFENAVMKTCFQAFAGKMIFMPHRFRPDPALLEMHRETVFRS